MGEERNDVNQAAYFAIEIEGIQSAKFYRCEGLEAETYVHEVEEGGLNTNTHKFFGRTRYPNIVLEHGVTDNNELFEWYTNTVLSDKAVERKNGSIILYKTDGKKEIKRWNFYRAFPCRWVGPKLGVNIQGAAIERIEIAHEGIEVDNT
ncbi:MAG: phage tail protein [Spirochaetales bacterium]|nr:phage tail protein [Spirochaetales bacterium]